MEMDMLSVKMDCCSELMQLIAPKFKITFHHKDFNNFTVNASSVIWDLEILDLITNIFTSTACSVSDKSNVTQKRQVPSFQLWYQLSLQQKPGTASTTQTAYSTRKKVQCCFYYDTIKSVIMQMQY
jgi:hypothetical protein